MGGPASQARQSPDCHHEPDVLVAWAAGVRGVHADLLRAGGSAVQLFDQASVGTGGQVMEASVSAVHEHHPGLCIIP